jgi:hypothetical protein
MDGFYTTQVNCHILAFNYRNHRVRSMRVEIRIAPVEITSADIEIAPSIRSNPQDGKRNPCRHAYYLGIFGPRISFTLSILDTKFWVNMQKVSIYLPNIGIIYGQVSIYLPYRGGYTASYPYIQLIRDRYMEIVDLIIVSLHRQLL